MHTFVTNIVSVFAACVMLLAGCGLNISHHCLRCHHHEELICLHACCAHEQACDEQTEEYADICCSHNHEQSDCHEGCDCWFRHLDIDNYQPVRTADAPAPQQIQSLQLLGTALHSLLLNSDTESLFLHVRPTAPPKLLTGRTVLKHIHKLSI